jgi:hypothetical protein
MAVGLIYQSALRARTDKNENTAKIRTRTASVPITEESHLMTPPSSWTIPIVGCQRSSCVVFNSPGITHLLRVQPRVPAELRGALAIVITAGLFGGVSGLR